MSWPSNCNMRPPTKIFLNNNFRTMGRGAIWFSKRAFQARIIYKARGSTSLSRWDPRNCKINKKTMLLRDNSRVTKCYHWSTKDLLWCPWVFRARRWPSHLWSTTSPCLLNTLRFTSSIEKLMIPDPARVSSQSSILLPRAICILQLKIVKEILFERMTIVARIKCRFNRTKCIKISV